MIAPRHREWPGGWVPMGPNLRFCSRFTEGPPARALLAMYCRQTISDVLSARRYRFVASSGVQLNLQHSSQAA